MFYLIFLLNFKNYKEFPKETEKLIRKLKNFIKHLKNNWTIKKITSFKKMSLKKYFFKNS